MGLTDLGRYRNSVQRKYTNWCYRTNWKKTIIVCASQPKVAIGLASEEAMPDGATAPSEKDRESLRDFITIMNTF